MLYVCSFCITDIDYGIINWHVNVIVEKPLHFTMTSYSNDMYIKMSVSIKYLINLFYLIALELVNVLKKWLQSLI